LTGGRRLKKGRRRVDRVFSRERGKKEMPAGKGFKGEQPKKLQWIWGMILLQGDGKSRNKRWREKKKKGEPGETLDTDRWEFTDRNASLGDPEKLRSVKALCQKGAVWEGKGCSGGCFLDQNFCSYTGEGKKF